MASIRQMVLGSLYANIWNNSQSKEEYNSKANWAKAIYEAERDYGNSITDEVYSLTKNHKCDKYTAIEIVANRMSGYIEYLVEKGWIKW